MSVPVTIKLNSLQQIAQEYDAIVLDQWGVLHNGTEPYSGTVNALLQLSDTQRLAVLSNSGKRALPNRVRIEEIGFPGSLFETVMTSGEALWTDIRDGRIPQKSLFALEREPGDAREWATGLEVSITSRIEESTAILLMGLPDGSQLSDFDGLIQTALKTQLPMYCSNPDRASPRPGGLVVSPGALAFEYQEAGGQVTFYGKPHRPVFDAIRSTLKIEKILMVGDSLEHDIAGASKAGWDSVLIQNGIYANQFAGRNEVDVLQRLVQKANCSSPTYRMEYLR